MTDPMLCSGSYRSTPGYPVLMDDKKATSTIHITWCARCQHRVLVMHGQVIAHYPPVVVATVDRQPEQPALAPKGRTPKEQLAEPPARPVRTLRDRMAERARTGEVRR